MIFAADVWLTRSGFRGVRFVIVSGVVHASRMRCVTSIANRTPFRKGQLMTIDRRQFGQRVRVLLATLNLTQDELAEQLGVSRQAVSLWIKGQSLPHDTRMVQFEQLEQRAKTDPAGADVEGVYRSGIEELRRWLRTYTTRVMHAQADAFGTVADATVLAAVESHIADKATPPVAAPTPKSRRRGA